MAVIDRLLCHPLRMEMRSKRTETARALTSKGERKKAQDGINSALETYENPFKLLNVVTIFTDLYKDKKLVTKNKNCT